MKAQPINRCSSCFYQGDSWGAPDNCTKWVEREGDWFPGPNCPLPDVPEMSVKHPLPGLQASQDFIMNLWDLQAIDAPPWEKKRD